MAQSRDPMRHMLCGATRPPCTSRQRTSHATAARELGSASHRLHRITIWFQLASGRDDAALCPAEAPAEARAARLAAAVASAAGSGCFHLRASAGGGAY